MRVETRTRLGLGWVTAREDSSPRSVLSLNELTDVETMQADQIGFILNSTLFTLDAIPLTFSCGFAVEIRWMICPANFLFLDVLSHLKLILHSDVRFLFVFGLIEVSSISSIDSNDKVLVGYKSLSILVRAVAVCV